MKILTSSLRSSLSISGEGPSTRLGVGWSKLSQNEHPEDGGRDQARDASSLQDGPLPCSVPLRRQSPAQSDAALPTWPLPLGPTFGLSELGLSQEFGLGS